MRIQRTRPLLLIAAATLLGVSLSGCASDSRLQYERTRRAAFDLFHEGQRLEAAGELALALERYASAADLSPRPAFHHRAGRMHRLLGNDARADFYFGQALDLQPDFDLAGAERRLVRSNLEEAEAMDVEGPVPGAGRPSGPEAGEATALAQAPASPARQEPGRATRPASPPDAGTAFERLDGDAVRGIVFPELERDGDLDPVRLREQARQASANREWVTALRAWGQLASLDPADVDARLELARAYRMTGRTRRALEEYRRCTAIAPANPEVWLQMGNAQVATGDTQRAEQSFLRALETSGGAARAANNLGALYFSMGDPARALGYVEDAVTIDPALAAAHLNLALVLDELGRDSGRVERALETYLRLGGERAAEAEQWLVELRSK